MRDKLHFAVQLRLIELCIDPSSAAYVSHSVKEQQESLALSIVCETHRSSSIITLSKTTHDKTVRLAEARLDQKHRY